MGETIQPDKVQPRTEQPDTGEEPVDNSEVRGWFHPDELPPIDWQTGDEANGASGQVEVGPLLDGTGRVAMRHADYPDEEVVVYTHAEWEAFIGGVKDGEFDFAD